MIHFDNLFSCLFIEKSRYPLISGETAFLYFKIRVRYSHLIDHNQSSKRIAGGKLVHVFFYIML